MKNCPNQVQMAPFRLIICQNRSHRVWEASGTPPGFQNAKNPTKNKGFRVFSVFPIIFPYSPIVAVRCRAAPPVQFTLVV